MKKKLIALFMVMIMLTTLAACGSGEEKTEGELFPAGTYKASNSKYFEVEEANLFETDMSAGINNKKYTFELINNNKELKLVDEEGNEKVLSFEKKKGAAYVINGQQYVFQLEEAE